MKKKIIEAIRAVPIAGKTYEEYVEALAMDIANEHIKKHPEFSTNKYAAVDGMIEKAKREVAREIFEEIEKLSYRFMNDKHYIFGDMVWDINELKKKYTEEEK